jgi:carbonic anhydrase
MSIEKFYQGYQDFSKNLTTEEKEHYYSLSASQDPDVMLITCCDSRIDYGKLFNMAPGDLFVVRNVANIVPPYEPDGMHHGTSAAIEFAVQYLKVKDIIIMGHSNCGGIGSIFRDLSHNEFLEHWLDLVKSSIDDHHCPQSDDLDDIARTNVTISLKRLMDYPWVAEKVTQGSLKIHGWFFDIKDISLSSFAGEGWQGL